MNDSHGNSRSDVIVSLVINGVTGGVFGTMIAWGVNATVPSLLIAAFSGTIVMVAAVAVLLRVPSRYIPGASKVPQTLFNVTEARTAPGTTSEAIAEANREQQPVLQTIAICDGLRIGALVGAPMAFLCGIWHGSNHLLAYVAVGGILGAAIGALIRWRWVGASFALEVVLFRSLGFTAGYAVLGAIFGALFGLLLWYEWRRAWSVTAALIVAIPFATLFGVIGHQRLRHYRRANQA